MPMARSTGNSAASRLSCLASSWPMTASEISPASPANTASATACGLMARCVAAISSARLTTTVWLPWACGCATRPAPGRPRRTSRGWRRAAAVLPPPAGRRPTLPRGAAERGAKHDPRLAVGAGDGHDLVVEDSDARHQEGDREGQSEIGRASLRVVRDADHAQRGAWPQVLHGGELRVDHGLTGRLRAEHRPCSSLTRSMVTPSVSSGLAYACTCVSGTPPPPAAPGCTRWPRTSP